MSYDLYFKPKEGSISSDDFLSYFQGRTSYELSNLEAIYENGSTGVYFSFRFDNEPEPEDPSDRAGYVISFHINVARSICYILEAQPEVAAFVSHFNLSVIDEQIGGMGRGDFDAEKLIAGWTACNEFAVSALLRIDSLQGKVFHLPSETLQNAWQWNLAVSARQMDRSDACFVPKIIFLECDGTAVTAACWPDGIPIAIKQVDYFYVPRKDLAPRRFFSKKEDMVFVAWEVVLPLFRKFWVQQPDGSISLSYLTPPPEVIKFVKSLPVNQKSFRAIGFHQLLEREVYENCLTKANTPDDSDLS